MTPVWEYRARPSASGGRSRERKMRTGSTRRRTVSARPERASCSTRAARGWGRRAIGVCRTPAQAETPGSKTRVRLKTSEMTRKKEVFMENPNPRVARVREVHKVYGVWQGG